MTSHDLLQVAAILILIMVVAIGTIYGLIVLTDYLEWTPLQETMLVLVLAMVSVMGTMVILVGWVDAESKKEAMQK